MNDVPHLLATNEPLRLAASVLIQITLMIVAVLLASRLLRQKPVLRHSVLLGGLVCVSLCPGASYVADRMGASMISIAWPTALDVDRVAGSAEVPGPDTELNNRTPTAPILGAPTLGAPPSTVPVATEFPPELPTETAPVPLADSASRMDVIVQPEPDNVKRPPAQAEPAQAGVEPTPSSVDDVSRRFDWTRVLNVVGFVWLAGIGGIAIRLALAWRYLRRLRARSCPPNEHRLAEFRLIRDEVCQAMGVSRLPDVLVSDDLNGPISLGLIRPAIILPANLVDALTASQLRDILVHEMAHIQRHDQAVVLLQRLAGALFWPFPLMWRLNAELDVAREDVCDNYVLRHTEASQYSRMLLQLTECATPQTIPLAVGLWKCRRSLEQRVTALLDPRRTTATRLPRLMFCTLAFAFLGSTVFLAGARFIPANDVQAVEPPQLADNSTGKRVSRNKDAQLKPSSLAKDQNAPQAVVGANAPEQEVDPYDALYEVIMTRRKDGKEYGKDETSPSVFSWSEFPFDDQTFDRFNAALDALAALPQEKIEAYSPVQRALMQRNLWELFETTFNWEWQADWWWDGERSFPRTHLERRAIAQPKLASLVKRLALTKEQILALPNSLAATIESGEFATTHDPEDPFKPFLPSDLYSPAESSWICVGEDGESIPVDLHTGNGLSRSMFLQFLRLPGGRAATLEYMDRIRQRPHQFPVGTQFALVEQPLLISKDGELVVSPLVVSIQLRAYLDVGRDFRRFDDKARPTQCVAEFVLQPRQLMEGNAAMRAIGPNDFHFDAGAETATPGFSPRDPFMKGKLAGDWPSPRLKQCMDCHSRAGGHGVMTRSFGSTNGYFVEGNVADIGNATVAQKHEYDNWMTLQKYWRGERVEPPKPADQGKPEPKPEPTPDRFPDTPELRAALFTGVENEVVAELKILHTAVLMAEVGKLSEMSSLNQNETDKLRLAAQGTADVAVESARDSIRRSFKNNANNTLNEKILVDGTKSDPDLTAFRFNDRYVILDADGRAPAERNPYDSLRFRLRRRVTQDWLSVGFKFGSFGNVVGPKEADVQREVLWKKALAEVLTDDEITRYAEHSAARLKTTVVDMMVIALQFDLDLEDADMPAIRRRIEEQVNVKPTMYKDIESTVASELQRLKAEGLDGILSEEQLNVFPEHSEDRIKSTIVSLVLTALKFDLHLAESRLPVIRSRLEERINPRQLDRSVEIKAMRTRWSLKEKDFADVLSESELVLWRFTQEQHN